MDLVRKTVSLIEKEDLIREGDKVLIGASGGVDSTTLLYVLSEVTRKIHFGLGLAHLNHQLRADESIRDEDFVRSLAARFSIPYYLKRAEVKEYAGSQGLSLQHAGRELRYAFFEEVATEHGYSRIAIAHNLDDQVETFFLRLLKGTGIRGLSAIPLRRGRIIRPFLYASRQEIEGYSRDHDIPFVEDSSNAKTVYERNFIRKHLTPPMERLNPAFREKVLSLLQDIASVNQVFDGAAREFSDAEVQEKEEDRFVAVTALAQLNQETRFRVISGILTAMVPAFIPLREHIRLIEKVMSGEGPNRVVSLPHAIRVKRIYKRLCFTRKPATPGTVGVFPMVLGENRLDPFMLGLDAEIVHGRPEQFPPERNVAFFDFDKLGDLSVRAFTEGDRFSPLGMKHSVKVKDFFISQKIPGEMRRRIPLLLSGSEIIWVVGYRIDDRFRVEDDTSKVLRVTVRSYQ